jgi:CRP-like cAMP-binding protein
MQGKRIREVLLIESGTVKLSKVGCDGDEVILWMNGRSDVLEIPLDEVQSRYTCTARAVENCSILRWNARLLHGVMHEYPQIRANVNNIMAEKLTELEQRFRELTTESIAHRLARTVVRLVCSIGREHSEGILLSVTREELAKISGMSMFTTSRVISAWSDEGFILSLRKAIVVRDPCQFAGICKESPEGDLSGSEQTEECSSNPNDGAGPAVAGFSEMA